MENIKSLRDLYKSFSTYGNVGDKEWEDFYNYDTHGIGDMKNIFSSFDNGYYDGQRMYNITVALWHKQADDFGWYPTVIILIEEFPSWVVKKAFNRYIKKKDLYYKSIGLECPSVFFNRIINENFRNN